VKKVFLELGGKSANIVLDDVADPAGAIGVSAIGVCTHSGQGCAITTRLLLPRSRYDEFLEVADTMMGSVTYGDPWDAANLQGPLISAKQLDRVMGYIDKGKKENAKLLAGGHRVGDKGYFIEPTVFADVTDNMAIAQEEIFGPVMTILKFKDLKEVVERANKTLYGLAAAVWTKDITKAHAIADGVRAGTVWVNCYDVFDAGAPFGGYKQSGIGRELGEYGLANYTEVKTVTVKL